MTTHVDGWNPDQYQRFAAERAQPFHDLLALVRPTTGADVIDLGCGTGELTRQLHGHVGAQRTLGVDSSAEMLARALPLAGDGVSFAPGDIGDVHEVSAWDVVFANAALQWLPDHARLLGRLTAALRPGGQLAVQMPYNADHASHVVAAEVAAEEPFASAMGGSPPPDPVRGVQQPERYAELLYDLGYVAQHVRMQVYGHVLDDTAAVVEWTSGTTLVRFRRRLPADLYAAFVARYRNQLVAQLGDRAPYFYAFKRILLWGRRP